MTLDEAIKQHIEKAEELRIKANKYLEMQAFTGYNEYKDKAEESYQIAEWLKELKELRSKL